MEKNERAFIRECSKQVNKIVKGLNNNQIGWTVQISNSSFEPNVIYYSAQIEAPADGLQPLTWIEKDRNTLLDKLKETAKTGVNGKDVDKAWHEAEIGRAKQLIKYHEGKIKELNNSADKE